MLRALCLLLLLPAGVAVAQPEPARVTWPVPAMAARLVDRTLVVLTPDLRSARAIDVVDDRVLWETRIQDTPRGTHDVQQLPNGRVLVVAGPTLVVLDAATGAILARHGLAVPDFDRAFLWAENGICGMNTECAFQPIDCTDARPLGRPLRGEIQHRRRYDGSGIDSGCWSFDVELVGRRRDLLLLDVRNLERTGASGQVHPHARRTLLRLYVDARTGAIRSRRPIGEGRAPAAPPAARAPVLEVERDSAGGVRRARVRRAADRAVLARYDRDAWSLGEVQGRTVVLVYGGTAPSEVHLVRHDAAALR